MTKKTKDPYPVSARTKALTEIGGETLSMVADAFAQKDREQMYAVQSLTYDEQAVYAKEDSERKALHKEVEGQFHYASQILEAQSTGILSGEESFDDTGTGSVIDATRNTYLQEAKQIRERGERLRKSLERRAHMARQQAKKARKRRKWGMIGSLGGAIGLGIGAMVPGGFIAGGVIGSAIGQGTATIGGET